MYNHLRTVRNRLNLSQTELAQECGVTRQTIAGIEAGRYAPSVTVALRLARALGCRVEELFSIEEPPPLRAVTTEGCPGGSRLRFALAQVGPRWVAHPLQGDAAYRTETVPADALGTPEGEVVDLRLLEEPGAFARTVALAGCTPVLSLWARAAERWHPGLRIHWRFANSMAALRALARGEIHAAGIHLSDADPGADNMAYARQVLGEQPVTLVHMGVWDEGLAVHPGNPLGIRRGADLARPGVRLVNREPGAGMRLLLERLLAADGVPVDLVRGFDHEVGDHWEVVREVAAERADVGVTSAAIASAYGLEFVPVRQARYDLAIRSAYLEHPPVRQLLSTLDHPWIRSQFNVLGGFNTDRTGQSS